MLSTVYVGADCRFADLWDTQRTFVEHDPARVYNTKVSVPIALGLWLRAILITIVLSYIGARVAYPRPAGPRRVVAIWLLY